MLYQLEDLYPRHTTYSDTFVETQRLAFNDFFTFIKLVSPHLELGNCHKEAADFLSNDEYLNTLLLFPRGHLKSNLLAHLAVWYIVRDPSTTTLYASAVATLAQIQLSAIKGIIDSPAVSRYFPELMCGTKETQREKWSVDAFNVEHPLRKQKNIRDFTVKAAGVGAGLTGYHCDILMLDDITAPETDATPWTDTGRDKVERWYSQASSILNAGGITRVVGTRYHPKDIYSKLITLSEVEVDENGNVIAEIPLYATLQEVVEVDGEFLWARRKGKDGKLYGFDTKILNSIKAKYLDAAQFFAQYYNDPNDPTTTNINREVFQYYDKGALYFGAGEWFISGKPLTIYAAIDFAASIKARADFTSIVILGVDKDNFRYVLEIVRLKTNKISEMADALARLHDKWKFRRLRAETNATQGLVAEQIKDFLRRSGHIFSWDCQASRGEKKARILSILEPLFAQKIIFLYKGGNCELLEEELLTTKPPHDDISDTLAAANELATIYKVGISRNKNNATSNVHYHPRFGGIA